MLGDLEYSLGHLQRYAGVMAMATRSWHEAMFKEVAILAAWNI